MIFTIASAIHHMNTRIILPLGIISSIVFPLIFSSLGCSDKIGPDCFEHHAFNREDFIVYKFYDEEESLVFVRTYQNKNDTLIFNKILTDSSNIEYSETFNNTECRTKFWTQERRSWTFEAQEGIRLKAEYWTESSVNDKSQINNCLFKLDTFAIFNLIGPQTFAGLGNTGTDNYIPSFQINNIRYYDVWLTGAFYEDVNHFDNRTNFEDYLHGEAYYTPTDGFFHIKLVDQNVTYTLLN